MLFDFKRLPGGEILNAGTTYASTGTDWLVAASPPPVPSGSGLNYALLRAAGSPGSEPIGGDHAEPGAALRGWITAPMRPYDAVSPGKARTSV
jgi:hypothetical protein